MRARHTLAAARWSAAALAALVSGGWSTAFAGVSLSPVSVELSQVNRVGSVTLQNKGDAPVVIQASAARWTQPEGVDDYKDTGELLVAPAIVEIAPGASQIFRVTLRGAFPVGLEQAFRLYLEDVTAPEENTGISLRIRHDLPVMVAGAKDGKPAPRVAACPAPTPPACVRLYNDGDRRLKVAAVKAEAGGWRETIPAATTVLAGAWRQWRFKPDGDSGPLSVAIQTSAGDLAIQLPAAAR